VLEAAAHRSRDAAAPANDGRHQVVDLRLIRGCGAEGNLAP
jgi:hypothetical protein